MNYIAIYRESFKSLLRLGPQRAGEVLYAMIAYANEGTVDESRLDETQLGIMDFFVDKYDRDA